MISRTSATCRAIWATAASCALAVVLLAAWPAKAAGEQESAEQLLGSGRGMNLYEPSLPEPVILPTVSQPKAESPQELLASSRRMDLYKPSLPAPISVPELETHQVVLTDFHAAAAYQPSTGGTGDLYAPSSELSELLLGFRPVEPSPRNDNLEPPRELSKVSLQAHRIAPPDVLQIEAIKLVPRQPYRIETSDVLNIRVSGTLLDEPINSLYTVQLEGELNLGPIYGSVYVLGLTVDEAAEIVTRQLQAVLHEPVVSMYVARAANVQQVNRTYHVQPDGTINLGRYGMVHVAGKTMTEARLALEKQLALYFDGPQVGLDVVAYNSNTFCVVLAAADRGQLIQRFPVTGNETVLDALSLVQGVPQFSSRTMWVARPAPGAFGKEQILPVDFEGITHSARTDTNYQLLPGDRLYIAEDKLLATGGVIGKHTSPIERMLNISSLGASAVNNLQTLGRAYNRSR